MERYPYPPCSKISLFGARRRGAQGVPPASLPSATGKAIAYRALPRKRKRGTFKNKRYTGALQGVTSNRTKSVTLLQQLRNAVTKLV